MLKFYIFEAGATKTAFYEVFEDRSMDMILPPFNANRDYSEFEDAVKNKLDIVPNSKIVFYGSGLGDEKSKEKVKELFKSHSPLSLDIENDILGGARALFNKESGVFGILGTGGLAASFNGEAITGRRGGYGYLLGDVGGGFELGKRFIQLWLDGDLSERAEAILTEKLLMDKKTFVPKFYANQDLGFVANLVPYVLQFEDETNVKSMIQSYFGDYLKQNIVPLCLQEKTMSFSAVGSIAYLFRSHIDNAAADYQLKLDNVIKSPIKALIEYHKE